MKRAVNAVLVLVAALSWHSGARAEPYIAVREGFKCMVCHVNPTGGAMRNAFGLNYAQNLLPAEHVESVNTEAWSNMLDNLVTLGGDLRAAATYTDIPHQSAQSAFETQEFRLYAAANVIPDRLMVYADERLAPGGALNEEAYARLIFGEGRYYLKAGQMYLPYGLRLEDDSAFIRAVPGINMTTPDNGAELGLEIDNWSAQFAASNGSAGGAETNQGKQASLRGEYVSAGWRAGASYNYNDAKGGARRMQNVFGGLRTGPLAWLAELDYVSDGSFKGGTRKFSAALLETNWNFRKGHNLKATGEYLDPDTQVGNDQQVRWSLLWEWTPMQFVQLRGGLRSYDGIPQNDLQNRRTLFAELHGFF